MPQLGGPLCSIAGMLPIKDQVAPLLLAVSSLAAVNMLLSGRLLRHYR